ncbi:MAG: hypothetical protein ACLTZY_05940 [Alistipes indistinctus]
MKQRFYKYEGAGNDFVVIDGRTGGFIPGRERVAFLCDRRRGIGADGLMILGHDPEQQFLDALFQCGWRGVHHVREWRPVYRVVCRTSRHRRCNQALYGHRRRA